MSNTDHDLMSRASGGDVAAFDCLIRRWQTPLVRILSRLVGNRMHDQIDDLSQEVFLRVYTARERYRPRAAFATWLYHIALNVTRDAARRTSARERKETNGGTPTHPEPSPDVAAQKNELRSHVNDALESLPRKLREPLVLRHFGELTFLQIAEVLGCSESTVKSRVATGLLRLRGEMRAKGIGEEELNDEVQ